MRRTMLLALICAGFAIELPAVAANVSQSAEQKVSRTTDFIAQYRRNDRRFSVYYRYRGNRRWILENSYFNRRDAERASRRLERSGYLTYIQLSRQVNRRYG
jgi:hypothetical protein